jgi:Beta-propeller repeat
VALVPFDTNALLNYYRVSQPLTGLRGGASRMQTPAALPPWDIRVPKPSQESRDVSVRSTDPYFDPKDKSLTAKPEAQTGASSQLEAILRSTLSRRNGAAEDTSPPTQDNNKLFALYKALNRLEYIAQMANREGAQEGVRPGLDRNFQDGLKQIRDFLKIADFSNLTVLEGKKSATAQSAISIAYPKTEYIGGSIARGGAIMLPLAGVTAADSFTISVTKAGVTTPVAIDLANVTGPLTADNINTYVNEQLKTAGFGARFSRVQTGGDVVEGTATWGIRIRQVPNEKISLSAAATQPALYVAGATGKTDVQGKLIKLTGLSASPDAEFSESLAPEGGNASAKATVTDADGNVYVVGNTSGSFGSAINQGTEDVFLSKYDSAGSVQWTKLLGSADKANAFGLAVDPNSGGVVIAGSVTGKLSPDAIGGGTDSFAAKYDKDGNQIWVRQIAPTANDSAHSVSVDGAGNIYVAGQTEAVIGSGQTSAGGTDAYFTKLSSSGDLVFHRQFGTSGTDAAMKTAVAADGNLVVASIQNGRALLAKYDTSGTAGTPMWQIDLGDLQGGTIGGIAAANGHIYLTGTSANASLDAGGAATVAAANSGGADAFVFAATDSGATASADFVSYAGTVAADKGGGIAVHGGKLYVTGSTLGTFAGETRHVAQAQNLFVAQLSAAGAVEWTRQYGGFEGESSGVSIAVDAQGASILDALKLPRGKIENNQSNLIESQTTARAGDYFTVVVEKGGNKREKKVVLAEGETLRSLALKINSALVLNGKAKTQGIKGGQGLKISANEGVTVHLVAGPKDFDALAGLGLKSQTLIGEGKDSKIASGPETIGLGIDGALNLLKKDDAARARTVLMGAQSQIKQLYAKLTSPPAPEKLGPAPAHLQSQIAGYQTALAWLSTVNGTGG